MIFDKWLCDYAESKDRNLYGEELEAVKAAWEAAQPKWLPIESAPLNEYVLLVLKHNETPLVGLLTSRDHEGGGSVELAKDGYTVSSGMYCGGAVAEEDWLIPTHWMPLPLPPKEQ